MTKGDFTADILHPHQPIQADIDFIIAGAKWDDSKEKAQVSVWHIVPVGRTFGARKRLNL